jgi:hypothetical protein
MSGKTRAVRIHELSKSVSELSFVAYDDVNGQDLGYIT